MTDSHEYGDTKEERHGTYVLQSREALDTDHPDAADTVLAVGDTYFGFWRGATEPVIRVVESDEYPDPLREGSLRAEPFFWVLERLEGETISVIDIEESPFVEQMAAWSYVSGE